MGRWGELTPATIIQIAYEVREGIADPDDASRLLAYYCECIDTNAPTPPQLTQHLKDSFLEYLSGAKTIEAALGLRRKRGRPKADEETRTYMALEVLIRRMRNISHQDALAQVAEEFSHGVTVVGESWAAYKQDAYHLMRAMKYLEGSAWDRSEIERLSEIYKDEPWFVAPGK